MRLPRTSENKLRQEPHLPSVYSGGELLNELAVAFQKIELPQSIRRFPARGVIDSVADLTLGRHHAKKDQLDRLLTRILKLIPGDLMSGCVANTELFLQLSCQRLRRRLTSLYLAAWE